MSSTITSFIEGFNGVSYVGPVTLAFKDGVAYEPDPNGSPTDKLVDADRLPAGVRSYLLSTGFTIGDTRQDPVESLDGNPIPDAPAIDARDYDEPTQVGTRTRDAAVDPQPGDFLAPTNAGEADPHGPDVVSPEIHASEGVRPVLPGDVHVDDLTVQDERETADAEQATDGTPVVSVERPAGNASRDDWAAYALASGASEADIEGKGRDELRDLYPPQS